MSFVSQSLAHPWRNRRDVQIPNTTFRSTNGVPHNFGLSASSLTQGMSTLYDRGTNFNDGVTIANQPITKQFAQRTDMFGYEQSGLEQPVFTSGASGRFAYEPSVHIVGLYSLNYYLSKDENREQYADDFSFTKFNKDWSFCGIQKSKERGDNLAIGHDGLNSDTRYMTITVGGRAHCPDITRAQAPGRHRRGTVNDNDVIWWIPRFYKDNNNPKPYIQIEVYATTNHMPPDMALYTGYIDNHYWASTPIRLGFVNIVHGDRAFNHIRMQAARSVLKGDGGDHGKLYSDLNKLTSIDVMVGVNH